MLAAIHIRQTHTPTEDVSYAALTWEKEGRIDTFLFSHPGSAPESRYAAGLSAFEYVVNITSQNEAGALVHITDASLRREITEVAASFPSILMIDTVRGRLVSMVDRSARAISDRVAALWSEFEECRLEELRALPALFVATDASKSSQRRGTGAAYVSSDGKQCQRMFPQVKSILAGELLAIGLAVTAFPERKLHILTDSQSAIACLRMSHSELLSRCDREVLTIVENIQYLLRGRTVRISWVKGHHGHPLNEIADRLAVSARRNYEARVPASVQRKIAENIMADLDLAQAAA